MKNLLVALFLIELSLSNATAEIFQKQFFNPGTNLQKSSQKNQIEVKNGEVVNLDDDLNRGWILSSQGKKALKNFILQMPCGWPEYGIPPLAPYTNEEVIINVKTRLIKTVSKLIRLRVDGLDKVLINKFKINYTFGKKVKYSLTLPKVVLSGKIASDIFVDLMSEYGVNIRYDGEGNFDLILEDITIEGSFKYKVPFIFGSIKIYDFDCIISLGKVNSQIKFDDTFSQFNELLNNELEGYLWRMVNYNKNRIGVIIEENVVSVINQKMKGHKIWYLLKILSESKRVCYPPPMQWKSSDDEQL